MKRLDIKLIKNPKSQAKPAVGTLKVEIRKNEGSLKDKKRLPETKVNLIIKKMFICYFFFINLYIFFISSLYACIHFSFFFFILDSNFFFFFRNK